MFFWHQRSWGDRSTDEFPFFLETPFSAPAVILDHFQTNPMLAERFLFVMTHPKWYLKSDGFLDSYPKGKSPILRARCTLRVLFSERGVAATVNGDNELATPDGPISTYSFDSSRPSRQYFQRPAITCPKPGRTAAPYPDHGSPINLEWHCTPPSSFTRR